MVSKVKLMIDEDKKFQGKAVSFSHTKTAISTIKEKLSMQYCFGHLLLIKDLKWTGQIVHELLLRKANLKTVSQIWAFEAFPALAALYFVVHEENDHIPYILQWRNNTSALFHELMSQVFENCEAYWSWDDND
ncbi:unnamed protein product [Prunus brigantina]